jgi:GNAT superfamily N-acetyltransferase
MRRASTPTTPVFFRAGSGQAERIVAEISAFYRQIGCDPAAYVDALHTPADLIPTLKEAGFRPWAHADNDLMFFTGPDVALPADYAIEEATTDAARGEWVSVLDEASAADPQTRAVLRDIYLRQITDPRMRAYLIRLDGLPVCRCQLFSARGYGHIEAVRTLDGYQRRGLAAAIIRGAMRDSLQMGNKITYLFAEPGAGPQRLYYRLGFRAVAQSATLGFILEE